MMRTGLKVKMVEIPVARQTIMDMIPSLEDRTRLSVSVGKESLSEARDRKKGPAAIEADKRCCRRRYYAIERADFAIGGSGE